MDQASSYLDKIKQIKCSKHNYQSLDLIDLTGKSENGRMCLVCAQKSNILHEQYMPIQELFAQKEGEILNSYPPFKNQNIFELIQMYCQENVIKQNISAFFEKLREDIEAAIQVAENKAKQDLIKNENSQYILRKEMIKIAETDKLKQLLVSDSTELNIFLQEKWKNSEQNEQTILEIIDQIKETSSVLNLEKKKKEVSSLIESLKSFSLLDQQKKVNIINQTSIQFTFVEKLATFKKKDVNLIKSTYKNSEHLTIKADFHSLQLENATSISKYGQAFLNFVLDPKKRYSIKLNYQPRMQNDYSFFLFGLVLDSDKDKEWGNECKMSYHNQSDEHGISKYIKGDNITNSQLSKQKEEFEVKIFLEEKILKVASLPGYSSILRLDNPDRIQTGIEYRFYVHIGLPGDMIEITEVIESEEFENDIF